MANRNGMGPAEQGQNTGRGLGFCNNTRHRQNRLYLCENGPRCRRDFKRQNIDSLTNQKAVLEQKLKEINNQLYNY